MPGIGEKTAAKLINTYGTLEEILAHLDELPPKQRENLTAMADRVLLNREMSILRRDSTSAIEADDLRQGAFDREQVRVLFDQLEFRTLFPRLMEAVGAASAPEESASETPRRRGRTGCATPRPRSARIDALRAAGAEYAVEARWVGRGRAVSASTGSRSPTATAR